MIFAIYRLVLVLLFRFLGYTIFVFFKKRRDICIKNLKLCFPKKNEKEIVKIAKKSFILLGHSFADFLLVRFYTKDYIKKHLIINGLETLERALDNKAQNGVVLYAAHFGSFELAAHFLALNGYKSLILYNPIKNSPWFEKFVKNNREYSGNTLIQKQNSLLTVYKWLRRNKIVLFAADQNCSKEDGLKVALFNNKTWTHTGFINLSIKTHAPIVSGFIYTKNLFDYEIKVFSPIYPEDFLNCENPEYQIAIQVNKMLEKAIKKSPAHWMWQHRRFKNIINY